MQMEEIPLLVIYPKSYFGQTQKDIMYLGDFPMSQFSLSLPNK